jgi:D-3-phosphoglycerate dehydrogenase
MAKVLVSDPVAAEGVALLRHAGHDVDEIHGLPKDELIRIIGGYDALAVRSETKVTADVLEAAKSLKIIGRAGVGVDNIDVEQATRQGVLVVNSPEGNTIAAAELTVTLLLALSRNVPQAHATMKAGEWKRSKYVGVEVFRKSVGVIGLGKIGREVARRLIGLEMTVLGYDPFLSKEQADAMGVRLVDLDTLYRGADFITVHVPKTKETAGMVGPAEFAKMKDGVRVINVARGGIIQEGALLDALNAGKVAGAAIDVWEKEPVEPESPLALHPNVVATPHLGASTEEAQVGVAVDIANQIVEVLAGRPATAAVNMPSLAPDVLAATAPYLNLAEKIGSMQSQLSTSGIHSVEVRYEGDFASSQTVHLTRALMKGLLEPILSSVNYVNAPALAQQRGIRLTEARTGAESPESPDRITVTAYANSGKSCMITGTVFGTKARIVGIDEYGVDFAPEGVLIVTQHTDRPGIVGRVGTLLGERGVNIAGMYLGRAAPMGHAVMALSVDTPAPADVLQSLAAMDGMEVVRQVEL